MDRAKFDLFFRFDNHGRNFQNSWVSAFSREMEYEKPSATTFLLKENGQKSVLDSQEPILLVVSREFPRFFAPKVIRLDDNNERLLLFEFHIK